MGEERGREERMGEERVGEEGQPPPQGAEQKQGPSP